MKAADVHPAGYPNVVAIENMGKKLSECDQRLDPGHPDPAQPHHGDLFTGRRRHRECGQWLTTIALAGVLPQPSSQSKTPTSRPAFSNS